MKEKYRIVLKWTLVLIWIVIMYKLNTGKETRVVCEIKESHYHDGEYYWYEQYNLNTNEDG